MKKNMFARLKAILRYIELHKKYVRILLLIIKLCNIEDLLYNISNEILFIYNEDNNNLEKKEYNDEINRGVLIVKCIVTTSIIC
jgi:hypothetical protein